MGFKIIDIHCHPSMKPYNNEGYRPSVDIWLGIKAVRANFDKVPKMIRKQIQETQRDSQSHLNEFIKGDIKSGFFVIHPAERGWFVQNKDSGSAVIRAFLRYILRGDRLKYLAASLTGFPYPKVEQIFESVENGKGIDYFKKESYKEYEYLRNNEGSEGSWDFKYEIVHNYEDYKQVLTKAKVIPVIITIEGGHAITNIPELKYFKTPYDELPEDFVIQLHKELEDNISRIKGRKPLDENGQVIEDDEFTFNPSHTPFFVTLSHMYNNLLAGHAKTYGGAVASLLDQIVGLNDGISPAGWQVIEQLLSRENGQRILIDLKHLSVRARLEYYQLVKDRREKQEKDMVPIVCSHAAMNGFEKNDVNRVDDGKIEKDSYFSRWSINLSNEDIIKIHESDGIIGLVIHEGRMPGKRAKSEFKKFKKKIRQEKKKTHEYVEKLKNAYLKLIMSNIYQVVTTINSKKGWEHLGIGSDYDGIMDPFDFYKTSGTFQNLMLDIYDYLTKPAFDLIIYKNNNETVLKATEVPNYFFGYSPKELVENIGYKNVERFMSKYFTKEYLT